jgi:hypothetical protein
MSNIKTILKEATGGALNDEVLSEIENVFEQKVNDKVELHVESALTEQDELYSQKLEELIEHIDADHSGKLKEVVEAVDADRANKLKAVITKYEKILTEDAEKFQTNLIESISDYIDVYIEEKIPTASIQEAIKNTKAKKVLENLRSHLAVDSALEKVSVKDAILDGHNQISEATTKLNETLKENTELKANLNQLKAETLLESKLAGLNNSRAKTFAKKTLSGKDAEFIAENFDYTVKLFKKKEESRLENLKEEAYETTEKVDRVIHEDVITENSKPSTESPYLTELSKY